VRRDDLSPGPDESLDRLSRSLWLLQRKRGHRATSDDVMLAALAVAAAPTARRALDLGTGKCTVALLMANALPACRFVGVEAFAESHALGVRNIALNGLGARIDVRLGDLRDAGVLAHEAPFDLVTGAPPFMPLGSGVLPSDAQRAAGRFETRGGIEAYADAAARSLDASGRAVLLMDGASAARARAALARARLTLIDWIEVRPRPERPPTFHVFVAAVERGGSLAPAVPESPRVLSMRDHDGDNWHPEYAALRATLDLDPVGTPIALPKFPMPP